MKNKFLISLTIIILAIGGTFLYRKNTQTRTPTSADNAPPGNLHNLPVPEAVSKVRKFAASETGTDESLVIIQTALEKEWSDACLGLAGSQEFCAQIITPGYEVVVEAAGKTLVYRTNKDGSVIKKQSQ